MLEILYGSFLCNKGLAEHQLYAYAVVLTLEVSNCKADMHTESHLGIACMKDV